MGRSYPAFDCTAGHGGDQTQDGSHSGVRMTVRVDIETNGADRERSE